MELTRTTASLAATLMIVTATVVMQSPAVRAQSGPVRLTSSDSTVNHNLSQNVEQLQMLVKSSRILTLEDRIPRFQVHNEQIVGATPVSQNQIQIFAKGPGTTQLNLWDTNDKLYTVNVTVVGDAREVEGILSAQLPLATLKCMPINDACIVSGTVTSVDDVDKAVAIVEQYYATVVNNIKVVGVQQVLLHTRIMEVSRTKLRDLGVDWGAFTDNGFFISSPSNLVRPDQVNLGERILNSTGLGQNEATNSLGISGGDFLALIKALREQKLVKYLAEPTVVATHGRPSRFNVGGKIPYIIPAGNGAVAIQYEEYGTSIDFLPFVVGPGRVRLEVRPEVTEIDPVNGLVNDGLEVTAFSQRYVETAVEMQAGQTLAIAGLLHSRTESVVNATPFIGEIPYIGALFRRVAEERNEIELLITVTPELVDAMDPFEVPRGGPGLNSMSPNDKELYLNGHIEVPNLLGQDGDCGPDHPDYSGEGFSTIDGNIIESTPGHPARGGLFGGSEPVGEIIESPSAPRQVPTPQAPTPQAPTPQPTIPQGAVVPTETGVIVGDGISISAPAQ